MNGGKRKLVGFDNFVRHNPKSDRFQCDRFHHFEFYCGDAINTARRFAQGLGMTLVAKSDNSTGNHTYASYVLKSNQIVFVFTAPYGSIPMDSAQGPLPQPTYNKETAFEFFKQHGLAARACGIVVGNAVEAFNVSVANGAVPVTPPTTISDEAGTLVYAEVKMYADVVLRYVSGNYSGHFLPHYQNTNAPIVSYGLQRLDHAVSNVPNMLAAVDYVMNFTGWHEFAEFTAEDVGTVDSGLNSMVLANNSEMILLPFNEPTHGTKRKSQIQTYLEQNGGEGLQHFALKTDDIFHTMRLMRAQTQLGGFDFMPKPSDSYYRSLPAKIGDILTAQQYKEVEELGLLVDKDDQGVLLQIFTKPLGDRNTCFIEIIQRLCTIQKPGEPEVGACGGFGKGNFSELFKSIEDYEKELEQSAHKKMRTQ
eukprot:TRINITY_DN1576_c0_g1_i1.p1 TRINITY_DN1576_c0_g1~~TRINITY_DN1576_c0_g1_i1.p1  ORF type:complete len:433 (+),score=114.15 TRINITY_DN1576_c0_g1_i1:34-1299(+)